MEPPVPGLKLIITKGPKSGETLEFKAGSLVRIGRVKRGNTFAISEDGISTKHLRIESKSGKWTLQDLNSSNGTILNSNDLPPNTPLDLHDDDTIKIGEETAILVKFERVAPEEEPPLRRNPRRQASARVTRSQLKNEEVVENLKPKAEEAAMEEEKERMVTRKGRGRRRNVPELPPESGQVEVKETIGGDVVEKTKCEEEGKEKPSQLTQRGRGRRRNLQEMPLESEHVQIEAEACGIRVTRNAGGRRKNLPELPRESSPVQVENNGKLRSEVVGVSSGVKEGSDDPIEERVASGVEEKGPDLEKMTQEVGGVKEAGDRIEERVASGVEEKGPDLEKMTLGEWFDYMEVYLPKLIIKETEEMIEEMKRKAERVHEYMKQQRKEKHKS